MAGPVLSGNCQLTYRESVVPGGAKTSGAAGAAGGSSTFLTSMITRTVTVTRPSVTLTSTE